jgi:uncharacterized protein (TIGR00725 family)
MRTSGRAVFLGGVAADSLSERELAYQCGRTIGRLGYTLFQGGYNGLMEDAARGASEEGVEVLAITLAHKKEWGDFNPYIKRAIYATDLGQRLNAFFSTADVVIAMGGGVGTLHEIAAAIWYAGNLRRIPVILLGARAERLLSTLKEQGWIYESPTRPIDFLRVACSAEELDAFLCDPNLLLKVDQERDAMLLTQRLFDTGIVNDSYVRADGTKLHSYFDPFRLCADPKLIHSAAIAIAAQAKGSIDVVAGIALGGLPLATHVASVLDKPLLVVRPSPKAYGTYAQVEGIINPGYRALIVDDVVRHGTAMMAARGALELVNVDANEAACLLSYGRSGHDLLRKQGVTLLSLAVRTDHEEPFIDLTGGA